MIVYFLDQKTLQIKDVIETYSYDLKYDEETNSTSNFKIHKSPNAQQNDFVIFKINNKTKYQGIINEIQGEKGSEQVQIVVSDISNLFNRQIYIDNESLMDTSLEDFLYYTINKFFKNGDDDSKIAMSYISIVQTTQTSVKEPINDEDGIYNFHTFMTNCRQNKNISVDFKISQNEILVTIANIDSKPVIRIDTTNNDVINYKKVYELNITSKVTVKCGDTNNILNYYLLNNRTISTDKNDENRADGVLKTIYVDTQDKALEQATNTFKGNRYNHLVEFEIKQDSKIVNTDDLTIGRQIKIKTKDGIIDSYISSIEVDGSSNFIKYKSGNIRVDLIDKLKQQPYKIGVNKVDRANVKSSYSTGNNNTYNCGYINSIISYGSNNNGIWTKFADGTMICYGTVGPMLIDQRSTLNINIGLPILFVNTSYSVSLTKYGTETGWINSQISYSNRAQGSFTLNIFNGNTTTTKIAQYISYIAIGRWK